jgi:hypothetical protein
MSWKTYKGDLYYVVDAKRWHKFTDDGKSPVENRPLITTGVSDAIGSQISNLDARTLVAASIGASSECQVGYFNADDPQYLSTLPNQNRPTWTVTGATKFAVPRGRVTKYITVFSITYQNYRTYAGLDSFFRPNQSFYNDLKKTSF